MIIFCKNLWKKFKNSSLVKKIMCLFLLLLYIFIMVITIAKVDYEVVTPGVVSTINNVVDVKTDNDRGKIYTVGVYDSKRVSILKYWMAKLTKSIEVTEYNPDIDLDNSADTVQGVITKDNSITNAIICAYEKAGYDLSDAYKYNGIIVSAIYPFEKTNNLRVGDIITAINGVKVTSRNQVLEQINPKTEGFNYYQDYTLMIKRSGYNEELEVTFNFFVEESNRCTIGFVDDYTLDKTKLSENTPSWTIANQNSLGGSGGAMTALSIYNALTEEDITKGLMIVGTGTIDVDGKIGQIGGLAQKIETAVYYGAELFFLPKENMTTEIESLLKEKQLNYCVVDTFDDVINYLEGLE